MQTTGKNEDQEDLYTLAENAGYQVVKTQAEAEALGADSGKVIVIDEHLADSSAMSYELDRGQEEWALADYVEKGIEVLDNETGFFMMVEGGKSTGPAMPTTPLPQLRIPLPWIMRWRKPWNSMSSIRRKPSSSSPGIMKPAV